MTKTTKKMLNKMYNEYVGYIEDAKRGLKNGVINVDDYNGIIQHEFKQFDTMVQGLVRYGVISRADSHTLVCAYVMYKESRIDR